MIIFESRIMQHMGIVSLSTLQEWKLRFEFPSAVNQKVFETKVSKLLEDTGDSSKKLYFYKPEAYFHPSYRDKVAQHILDLSNAGFEVTLESDCDTFLSYFGEKIECKEVSKDDFKIRLELIESGESRFVDIQFDEEGLCNAIGDEHYPIGYFN